MTAERLGHCTPMLGGHSPACVRDGTYCGQISTHTGPCKPHGSRCPLCGHADHSRRIRGQCDAIVDNGWNWHGCHCDGPAALTTD